MERNKKENTAATYWWQTAVEETTCSAAQLKPGDYCPSCNIGTLDYDGLFLLTCSICKKVAAGGAFT